MKILRISAIALLCVPGCATLPDAEREMSAPHSREVKLENARGPVPEARSEAILSRLEARTGATDVLEKHLAFEQAITGGSPLVLGNALKLLQNGPDTYDAMFAAIRKAKDHINLETYIFDDGDTGRQFADLLLERQAAGVQVNVIRDSVGTLLTPKSFFERMREGGINVLEFNPVNPLAGNKKGWRINNRDHRRQLVIDGRIAFTGGVNISDTYSSAPSAANRSDTTEGWRDTHVEMQGPIVAEFQKLFMNTWARQKGEPLAPRDYFPALKPQGDAIVRAIGSRYEDNKSEIYLTLISAITHAEKNVHLTVAYFGPDPQMRQALTDAARRGVDVRIVLPSLSDSSPIFYLGRSYYTELLKSGVKIYQRHGGVMHAKTACIDGAWSTVGSTNLDWRSFLHNDEMNAVILGRDFAAQMEKMFADDLAESQQVTLDGWKRRPMMDRVKERFARLGAYWL